MTDEILQKFLPVMYYEHKNKSSKDLVVDLVKKIRCCLKLKLNDTQKYFLLSVYMCQLGLIDPIGMIFDNKARNEIKIVPVCNYFKINYMITESEDSFTVIISKFISKDIKCNVASIMVYNSIHSNFWGDIDVRNFLLPKDVKKFLFEIIVNDKGKNNKYKWEFLQLVGKDVVNNHKTIINNIYDAFEALSMETNITISAIKSIEQNIPFYPLFKTDSLFCSSCGNIVTKYNSIYNGYRRYCTKNCSRESPSVLIEDISNIFIKTIYIGTEPIILFIGSTDICKYKSELNMNKFFVPIDTIGIFIDRILSNIQIDFGFSLGLFIQDNDILLSNIEPVVDSHSSPPLMKTYVFDTDDDKQHIVKDDPKIIFELVLEKSFDFYDNFLIGVIYANKFWIDNVTRKNGEIILFDVKNHFTLEKIYKLLPKPLKINHISDTALNTIKGFRASIMKEFQNLNKDIFKNFNKDIKTICSFIDIYSKGNEAIKFIKNIKFHLDIKRESCDIQKIPSRFVDSDKKIIFEAYNNLYKLYTVIRRAYTYTFLLQLLYAPRINEMKGICCYLDTYSFKYLTNMINLLYPIRDEKGNESGKGIAEAGNESGKGIAEAGKEIYINIESNKNNGLINFVEIINNFIDEGINRTK